MSKKKKKETLIVKTEVYSLMKTQQSFRNERDLVLWDHSTIHKTETLLRYKGQELMRALFWLKVLDNLLCLWKLLSEEMILGQ